MWVPGSESEGPTYVEKAKKHCRDGTCNKILCQTCSARAPVADVLLDIAGKHPEFSLCATGNQCQSRGITMHTPRRPITHCLLAKNIVRGNVLFWRRTRLLLLEILVYEYTQVVIVLRISMQTCISCQLGQQEVSETRSTSCRNCLRRTHSCGKSFWTGSIRCAV